MVTKSRQDPPAAHQSPSWRCSRSPRAAHGWSTADRPGRPRSPGFRRGPHGPATGTRAAPQPPSSRLSGSSVYTGFDKSVSSRPHSTLTPSARPGASASSVAALPGPGRRYPGRPGRRPSAARPAGAKPPQGPNLRPNRPRLPLSARKPWRPRRYGGTSSDRPAGAACAAAGAPHHCLPRDHDPTAGRHVMALVLHQVGFAPVKRGRAKRSMTRSATSPGVRSVLLMRR